MTLTQYKKIISALPREELEAHLVDLFKTNRVFKDIESTTWAVDENAQLLESYQKKIEKAFWKDDFSLSECKAVLKDYSSRTLNPSTIALMHLSFAMEAAELSAACGDFSERFYSSLEKAAEVFLDYTRTDIEFFSTHEDAFQCLIDTCGSFGWGVQGNLEKMLRDAQAEVYGEEDENI